MLVRVGVFTSGPIDTVANPLATDVFPPVGARVTWNTSW